MKYCRDLSQWSETAQTVVTLGKFDGVHRGHALLLEKMHQIAKEKQLMTVVFTFDLPPRLVISEEGDARGTQLMTNAERRDAFTDAQIDGLMECPFTEELRRMSPEEFVRDVLCDRLRAAAVVAGDDFRFGRDRAGDARTLIRLGSEMGFTAAILGKVIDPETDQEISSTLIRKEVSAGRMEKAAQLLGRPYALTGEVLHGKELGRTIGVPTINQTPPPEKLLPPNGVYFSETVIDGARYLGVTNIGMRPTVDGTSLNAETHLLDAALDLYGRELTVSLLHHHRSERAFDSVEALSEQIHADIASARAWAGIS